MKRLVTASIVLAIFVVSSASAHVPGRVNCNKLFTLAHTEATAKDVYAGTGRVTLAKLQRLGHMELCQVNVADRSAARAYSHRQAAQHDARVSNAQATPASTDGGYGNVPGVPYAFASCVAFRESTDGQGSPDIYGILPMNGYYSGMSVPAQKALFSRMYAADGTSPWAPYDGC